MDLGMASSPTDMIKCCDCGCNCFMNKDFSASWIRTVKRKFEELEAENGFQFLVPGLDLDSFSNAKVQIEKECELLRETVNNQQKEIEKLYEEIEKERNAAATAADEAMSMIVRLQRQKAEIQMEARQFKLVAEEKIEHDQQVLLDLEDYVYKKDQIIHAMQCEFQAYKHRMMSYYGFTESETDGDKILLSRNISMIDADCDNYPPLKCNSDENPDFFDAGIDVSDIELSPGRNSLKNLEDRISQMERNPSFDQEKGYVSEKVITTKELRPEASIDSPRSNKVSGFKNMKEIGDDDMGDRIYTIDCVHNDVSHIGDPDIQKLNTRLQALEADRESMREEIMSMRIEQIQLVLLKEIAEHLSKEVVVHEQKSMKPPSSVGIFSFMTIFKWISSFVFWKKRALRSKYMNGASTSNIGLLLLLDKNPRTRQRRYLASTHV